MITVSQLLAKYPDFKFTKGDRIVTGDNSIVVINRPDRINHMCHAKVHSFVWRKDGVKRNNYPTKTNRFNWWKPDLIEIERIVRG